MPIYPFVENDPNIKSLPIVNTTWATTVANTVDIDPFIDEGWYTIIIDTVIRRTAGGTDTRRHAQWNFIVEYTSGSLSLVSSAEQDGYGGYAPSQAWDISGTDLTHTITSTASSGTVSYQVERKYRGAMT